MRDIPDPSPAPELPQDRKSRMDRANETRHNVALVGAVVFAVGASVAVLAGWPAGALVIAATGLVMVVAALLWGAR